MSALPEQLNRLLLNMGATYQPDYQKVKSTLEWSAEELKRYLGTYFPRSFVENSEIFKHLTGKDNYRNLFKNNYHNVLRNKKQLCILDIGSGTGGNLLGLLFFLGKYYKNVKEIYVVSIDGNSAALEIQKKLIDTFFEEKVAFELVNIVFKSRDDFAVKMSEFGSRYFSSYDIIMTFKFINEFYRKNFQKDRGMYRTFLEASKDIIDENGLILISDMTDYFNHSKRTYYFNLLMNQEIVNYYQEESNKLKPIFPCGCYFGIDKCQDAHGCFSQFTFDVDIAFPIISSRTKNRDRTKISYKVLASRQFADRIYEGVTPKPCSVNRNKHYKCYQGRLIEYPKNKG